LSNTKVELDLLHIWEAPGSYFSLQTDSHDRFLIIFLIPVR